MKLVTLTWWRNRPRRRAVILCTCVTLVVCYLLWPVDDDRISFQQENARRKIENQLQEELLLDKGTGCEMPELDPFAPEVIHFRKKIPPLECPGQDWVKCYHSKCRLIDAIEQTVSDVKCSFRDILFETDATHALGPATWVQGGRYELNASDHVKVSCVGRRKEGGRLVRWSGNTLGLRPVARAPTPAQPRGAYNVLVFGFDSTARAGFIRMMPKSWAALKELGVTVMEGYNIVGDGTPAALFPLLTGRTELELPDTRKKMHSIQYLDSVPFIFYTLKQEGYRTAYLEDSPQIGTFQYRLNGFQRPPTDHYYRPFSMEQRASHPRFSWSGIDYCVGDTPQFKLMQNITQQLLELDEKRFIFTFMVDVSHDDFNNIQWADDDTAAFLRGLAKHAEDTLIIVMGDHGSRFASSRDSLQGKLEECLPLMALRLPSRLARARPRARRALEANARALTTPHDVHSTILDALDLRQHWNPYRVPGADLPRGMTMLEPIPHNRSCSEAGVMPHWCACVAWQNVSAADPLYPRTAAALLRHINQLLGEVGEACAPRSLAATAWMLRARPRRRLLAFRGPRDADGYLPVFGADAAIARENYQVKVILAPGRASFEATMTYLVKEDKFVINSRDISRTNAYRNEPDCISATHPHLNPYCYCRR